MSSLHFREIQNNLQKSIWWRSSKRLFGWFLLTQGNGGVWVSRWSQLYPMQMRRLWFDFSDKHPVTLGDNEVNYPDIVMNPKERWLFIYLAPGFHWYCGYYLKRRTFGKWGLAVTSWTLEMIMQARLFHEFLTFQGLLAAEMIGHLLEYMLPIKWDNYLIPFSQVIA